MRVAIIGGTGFVGSYLLDALAEAGIRPVVLVRPGSESRLRHGDHCDLVSGSVADQTALTTLLAGADAVIYNVGILREQPARGISFDELQRAAPIRVMQAAAEAGVKRFMLMSANGVDADSTSYQSSKLAAEQHLVGSGLEATVFRPSVIFGDPRGRDEFASSLTRDIIAPPLPAPLFFAGLNAWDAGSFELSPVHVADVASAFTRSLNDPETIGKTLTLGGPENLSWRTILARLATVTGKRKLMLPAPALGISAAAALLDRFDFFPITRDQLSMLMQGNTCSDADLRSLGITPKAFAEEHLGYLRSQNYGNNPCPKKAA